MRYYGEESKTAFGHIATGGGATIKDSPINITININIGKGTRLEDDNGRPTEVAQALGFLEKLFRRGQHSGHEDGRGVTIVRKGAGRFGANATDAELMSVLASLDDD